MVDFEKTIEQKEFDKILSEGEEDDLRELKSWLRQENRRILAEKRELRRRQDKFIAEKKQFQEKMEQEASQFEIEQKIFKQEQAFFDKKMDILKDGFTQLSAEQAKLDKERLLFEAEKNAQASFRVGGNGTELAKMLFQGVNSQLALKKRYKDLIKMYHPDNVAGDHEMVLVINKVYEELRQEFEHELRA